MSVGGFRASYTHAFEPSTPPGDGEVKYQVTILIPKPGVNIYNAIVTEMNRALQEGLQKTFGDQMPVKPSMPLYDGGGTKQNGELWGEECRGRWVLYASSRTRPSVVDINIQPVLDPNAFYSGYYARAIANFYPYNTDGNRGVGCGLNNVQRIADGEPLSGRTTAEEDFGRSSTYIGSAAAPSGYGQSAYQAMGYSQPAWQMQPYQQPAMGGYPSVMASGYSAPQPGTPPQYQQAIGPVMGRPLPAGGVMGI